VLDCSMTIPTAIQMLLVRNMQHGFKSKFSGAAKAEVTQDTITRSAHKKANCRLIGNFARKWGRAEKLCPIFVSGSGRRGIGPNYSRSGYELKAKPGKV